MNGTGPGRSTDTGRIGIVAVTYSPGETLAAILDSLPAATVHPVEIVLADNGSNDASVEAAAVRPGVRLLPTGGNIGCGAAANAGFRGVVDRRRADLPDRP